MLIGHLGTEAALRHCPPCPYAHDSNALPAFRQASNGLAPPPKRGLMSCHILSRPCSVSAASRLWPRWCSNHALGRPARLGEALWAACWGWARLNPRFSREPIVWCQENRGFRSEEHTSELQSLRHLVCRLLLE